MIAGIQASMDPEADFWRTITWIACQYRMDNINFDNTKPLYTSEGELGIDGPHDDGEGEGEYIRIGFCLPNDVYAEIDDGTYGTLNAFRIYKEQQ